jgi:hypothetical protein
MLALTSPSVPFTGPTGHGGTKHLDACKNQTTPDAKVVIPTCHGGANQHWSPDEKGSQPT